MLIKPTSMYKIEKATRSFVAGLEKGDALLPIVLLELAVTGGRSYHAYKRGGFIEGRERLTEESVGAVFWLGGVTAFNKMGDLVGTKILRLQDVEAPSTPNGKTSRFGLGKIDYDVGQDAVRKPFENYKHFLSEQVARLKASGKRIPVTSKVGLAVFKSAKVLASILLANGLVGFVVPKLNQGITKKYQNSIEQLDNNNYSIAHKSEDFSNFVNKKSVKEKPNTSFKGNALSNLLKITNGFENDSRLKLLSTDVGIAGGRAYSARNKYERRENLFRDLGSLYFYLLCKNHINSLLNLVQHGKKDRLNPVTAKLLDLHLKKNLWFNLKQPYGATLEYSTDAFKEKVFGNKVSLPDEVKKLISGKEVVSLDEFLGVEKDSALSLRAKEMSKLQPAVEGKSILTAAQIEDVYTGGLINDPKFLNKVFKVFTNNKSVNPTKYVSEKRLRGLKIEMEHYIGDIVAKAKSSKNVVNADVMNRVCRENFIKTSLNLGVGFAVSAYFLSTAIPKIQYWLTKKQTGEDKFPGVQKYDK
mgnify:CR=1 FL=1